MSWKNFLDISSKQLIKVVRFACMKSAPTVDRLHKQQIHVICRMTYFDSLRIQTQSLRGTSRLTSIRVTTNAMNHDWSNSTNGTGTFRSHTLSFPGTKRPHSGRFVPGNESVDVSFPGTKLHSNICSHKLSSPTTVTLLGRRPTQYSICKNSRTIGQSRICLSFPR